MIYMCRESQLVEIPPSIERGSRLETNNPFQNDISDSGSGRVVEPSVQGEFLPVDPGFEKRVCASGMNPSTSWTERLALVKLKLSQVPRNENECAFCHSIRSKMECMGELLCIPKGKVVPEPDESSGDIVQYAHKNCLDRTPGIHFEGNQVMNLQREIERSSRQICAKCDLTDATIRCFYKHCFMTYHAPCSYYIDERRWDIEDRRILCPAHASKKLP